LLHDSRVSVAHSAKQNTIAQQEAENIALSARINALKMASGDIQGNLEAANTEIIRLKADAEEHEAKIKSLEDELHQAETLRRRLHNTIQELKGAW
jgi:kinesin family member C1